MVGKGPTHNPQDESDHDLPPETQAEKAVLLNKESSISYLLKVTLIILSQFQDFFRLFRKLGDKPIS